MKNQLPNLSQIKAPLFITFEGGEGAGKTTLIEKLASDLKEAGFSVVLTREPGGSNLSEHLRQLILQNNIPVSPKAELFLFLAARAQHMHEVIIPALEANKIVLCDRFADSTVAYQGYARGLGANEVKALSLFATNGREPDLTFYFDIDPIEGLKRRNTVSEKGAADRIESEKLHFHQQVREAFQDLAKKNPNRIKTLDAHQSKENVHKQALDVLQHFRQ